MIWRPSAGCWIGRSPCRRRSLFCARSTCHGEGTSIHYLIADAGGDAALVELYGGELVVVPASGPWHQATNFFVAPFAQEGLEPLGQCRRYDRIHDELESAGGSLTVAGALDLLSAVSTPEQLNGLWCMT